MAIIGIQTDRENPEFTKADFTFWMPQYTKYINFYSGRILVGQTPLDVSYYINNKDTIKIANYIVELITADEITYTGTLSITSNDTTVTYTVTVDASAMLLVLVSDSDVTTQCTLKSEGANTFNQLYEIANNKVFKSIYGSDWKLAMSYCIAHYATILAQQEQAPVGDTLGSIVGGGTTKGVLSSMSVGGFSKAYDIDKTMSSDDEAKFWNQTSYGSALWALLKTKNIASIFVVTSNPIPGAN